MAAYTACESELAVYPHVYETPISRKESFLNQVHDRDPLAVYVITDLISPAPSDWPDWSYKTTTYLDRYWRDWDKQLVDHQRNSASATSSTAHKDNPVQLADAYPLAVTDDDDYSDNVIAEIFAFETHTGNCFNCGQKGHWSRDCQAARRPDTTPRNPHQSNARGRSQTYRGNTYRGNASHGNSHRGNSHRGSSQGGRTATPPVRLRPKQPLQLINRRLNVAAGTLYRVDEEGLLQMISENTADLADDGPQEGNNEDEDPEEIYAALEDEQMGYQPEEYYEIHD